MPNYTQIQPYLNFDGRAEEAIEFYKAKLGAKVEALMRFKEAPDQSQMSPGSGEKVMHACIRIGDTQLMASDGRCQGKGGFQGIALAFNARDPKDAEKVFNALSDGGNVQMPLAKTFFSPAFGMLDDKFGVTWMVVVPRN